MTPSRAAEPRLDPEQERSLVGTRSRGLGGGVFGIENPQTRTYRDISFSSFY